MVENFDVSLCLSFIRKKRPFLPDEALLFFLMKLKQSETSKFSTIPVSPIMSLFNPKCSPSKWWQVARDLCRLKGSASTCLLPLMDRCGKIVSESNAKADRLNEVFINQNTSLAPDACVFGPSPLNVTFDLGNIYPSDVQRVLRSLPNKTSCGSNKISYRITKEAGQGLVGPLLRLLNASLRLRQVTDEWQKAIIKPIFKGGKKDQRDPFSYRPISLRDIPCVCCAYNGEAA